MSGRQKRTRSLYRYSSWVETTFIRGEKEILLPLRARAVFRGRKARGESEILIAGCWEPHKVFPWCDLRFSPDAAQRNIFAETVSDAIIEYFQDNDPEGFEALLAESPEVGTSDGLET